MMTNTQLTARHEKIVNEWNGYVLMKNKFQQTELFVLVLQLLTKLIGFARCVLAHVLLRVFENLMMHMGNK
jgi:hypothetical protein